MTGFDAFLYGVVQGATEYLPISSSAHLILLPRFLGTQDPGLTFDVFLHLGTLLSTLVYFWKDWLEILQNFFKRTPRRSASNTVPLEWIIIGTVPALIGGAALHSYVSTIFRGNGVLMTTLALAGVLLYWVDAKFPRQRHLGQMGIKEALFVGIAQCFALIPGVSRSGSTITAGRFLGFDRGTAARFSFLLSAPVTLAAVVYELRHWDQLFEAGMDWGILLIALLSSFVAGMLAIGGLLKMLKKFSYLSFAVYRVALAILIWQVLGL